MTHPDTKPEALRLADVVETLCVENTRQPAKAGSLAASAIRRLHAECESLRTQLAEAQRLAADRLEQMTADRAQALRWRDEALRADARRYRWLRSEDVELDGCALIYAESALDAAIDTAMGAKEGE